MTFSLRNGETSTKITSTKLQINSSYEVSNAKNVSEIGIYYLDSIGDWKFVTWNFVF